LGHHEHEVRRRGATGQLPGQAHADDARHGHVDRLAEERGLRLDAADAPGEDTKPVDHRGVGVGADDRVREGDARSVELAVGDNGGEVFEVDLVDDARARRDDAQVAECGLRPAQELVALAVPLVLARDVEREGARGPELVDLDRVVDHEVRGYEGIHARGIAAQVRHRVAHRPRGRRSRARP